MVGSDSLDLPLRRQKVHRITDCRYADIALAEIEQSDAIDDLANQHVVYQFRSDDLAFHNLGSSRSVGPCKDQYHVCKRNRNASTRGSAGNVSCP